MMPIPPEIESVVKWAVGLFPEPFQPLMQAKYVILEPFLQVGLGLVEALSKVLGSLVQ
jgi:hypothetical protein